MKKEEIIENGYIECGRYDCDECKREDDLFTHPTLGQGYCYCARCISNAHRPDLQDPPEGDMTGAGDEEGYANDR